MTADMLPGGDRGRPFVGWRIVVLAIITGAITGPGQTIGVSVFVDPMMATLDLTRSEVSTAYLIGTLLGALALVPVGRRIDKMGTRRAMAWIGVAFGIGLAVMSGIQGVVTLTIGFVLIRWLGQGSLGLVSELAITPWFERKRGLVFGVSTTATATLMALTPLFLGVAIELYGWRTAWILSAFAIWLVVVPIARFGIVNRPSDVGQFPDGDSKPAVETGTTGRAGSSTRRQALGQTRFWLLNLSIAATAMLVTALNFHQISILGAEGLTATEAAAMFLPQVVGTIIAGLIVGALADHLAARYLVALSMALLAFSLLAAALIEPGWHVMLYAIVLGAAAGAQRPLIATLMPRWYGLAHIGAIQGMTVLVTVAASATGPVLLSLVVERTGSYSAAAWLLLAIPLLIGLTSIAISEPKRATDG